MKYSIGKFCQSGQLRGHWSKVFSTGQIDFSNRRKAEKAAREMNRRHGISEDDEEIYAVKQNEAS